jgi:copper chaperone CopZ
MTTQITTFSVPDMHCASCPKLIKLTLEDLKGVGEVDASLDTKTVTVNYDPSLVTLELLISTIKEAGYTTTPQNYYA